MFNEATFGKILLPSSSNVNDYVASLEVLSVLSSGNVSNYSVPFRCFQQMEELILESKLALIFILIFSEHSQLDLVFPNLDSHSFPNDVLLRLNSKARGEHLISQLQLIAAQQISQSLCSVPPAPLLRPTHFFGLMVAPLTYFYTWGVYAILGNRYGIQGQNYVALLPESEITAEFPKRSLILG